MKKYIVYLTINIKNNKIYVGVHGTETPNEFDGYIGNGININIRKSLNNPKEPFEFAVKKYGFHAFKRTTIAIFDTIDEALDLEADIVNEEFVKRKDTYNIALGGGLPPIISKTIYQYSLEGKFIKEWTSIIEAANFFKISASNIGKAVLYKRTSNKYLWSDYKVEQLDLSLFNIYSPEIPVFVYDSYGKFVKKYKSVAQCAKELNTSLAHVQRSIKLGNMTCGYYISTELVSQFQKPKQTRLQGLVHQYDLNGKYIKSYNSIKEVEHIFGESMKGINNSIKLGQMYKNFLWLRGDKQEFVKPYKISKSSGRKIGQYTMDDKLVKVFDTVREARKNFPNVSKVLNGSATHCHNFKFKYLE